MPRLSRSCSTIDCDRAHFAHGYCRRCHYEYVEKPRLRARDFVGNLGRSERLVTPDKEVSR